MKIHVLVLNYNGRRLMEECLPSVVDAARRAQHECEVAVIDNASSDDSVRWLSDRFPHVPIIARPNRGLCSFNDVLPHLQGPVAILLNNDVVLDGDSIDPLVEALSNGATGPHGSRCFMAAPRCYRTSDGGYEGLLTAIRWRYGLVQATSLFAGCEAAGERPGLTASAGPVLAVCRKRFLELGGFDPLYLPGRLEDLDFAFRGYMHGYHACYVPESVIWHRGMATFARCFGASGCDRLALRNTLLFQWKNLRHPLHRLRYWLMLPVRPWRDAALTVAGGEGKNRSHFAAALLAAVRRWRSVGPGSRPAHSPRQEWDYFRRFHPREVLAAAGVDPAGARRLRQRDWCIRLGRRATSRRFLARSTNDDPHESCWSVCRR